MAGHGTPERIRAAARARRFAQLLDTRVGRVELWFAALNKAWPGLSMLARAHRRTLGRRTRVVAVVGSFGKTTTTRCIAAALGLDGRPPRDNCRSHLALATLLRTGTHAHLVHEVGIDHRGQMEEYARLLCPDVTVVTALGSEHARSLGDAGGARHEKGAMVRALTPEGLVVLNADDPEVLALRGETAAEAVTFGTSDRCDLRAVRDRSRRAAGDRVRGRGRG